MADTIIHTCACRFYDLDVPVNEPANECGCREECYQGERMREEIQKHTMLERSAKSMDTSDGNAREHKTRSCKKSEGYDSQEKF